MPSSQWAQGKPWMSSTATDDRSSPQSGQRRVSVSVTKAQRTGPRRTSHSVGRSRRVCSSQHRTRPRLPTPTMLVRHTGPANWEERRIAATVCDRRGFTGDLPLCVQESHDLNGCACRHAQKPRPWAREGLGRLPGPRHVQAFSTNPTCHHWQAPC